MSTLPKIIQGGMGAGVSNWRLARAVSSRGHLGVVAGTALDVILARRLQLGDLGGHMRRALAAFPCPSISRRIVVRYFVEGGKREDEPFRAKPLPSHAPSRDLVELTVAANFVEVFLAREGHANPVGINFLEKIQAQTLPSLFGAMLAGVGYVCMGAGLPIEIPGVLERLARMQAVELRLDVAGARPGEVFTTRFDPAELGLPALALQRPRFLAIVANDSAAGILARKANGPIDGFVVEAPSAGGHNAPPRGGGELDERGQPRYGPRDRPRYERFVEFGLPFWLAGSRADPQALAEALQLGATGIQVGTAFAFCEESGLARRWKRDVLRRSREGRVSVRTDPVASPTNYPFKVLELEGTLSEDAIAGERARVCDLGYLRHAYRRDDGSVGWRCPGECRERFVAKGGDPAQTAGRKCLCNGLLANIGLAQVRAGVLERPILTAGDDAARIARFAGPGADSYDVAAVLRYLETEPATTS